VSVVRFVIVVPAQRETIVVAPAAIAGVGKQDVLIGIITDPLIAA
jgi:hypothetical protein